MPDDRLPAVLEAARASDALGPVEITGLQIVRYAPATSEWEAELHGHARPGGAP